jgi:hypothetical protein
MRRFLILTLLLIIFVGMSLLTAVFVLAAFSPLRPDSPLFPLQHTIEQESTRLFPYESSRLARLIHLAALRARDLSELAGTPAEVTAMEYLSIDLDQALQAARHTPIADLARMQDLMLLLVDDLDRALNAVTLESNVSSPRFASLRAEVDLLRWLLVETPLELNDAGMDLAFHGYFPIVYGGGEASQGGLIQTGINPLPVAFPPGSPGALHSFYPLIGQHAQLACESCHTTGVYAGTLNQCLDCHRESLPQAHYPFECSICHNPQGWGAVSFNHALMDVRDCTSCHASDRPANHYLGQCSACHDTRAWRPATFDHAIAGATDCQDCHASNRPANHYEGQCSACHNTNAWRLAAFNHAVLDTTNCQACHASNRPSNHYDGQCSACHSTNAWRPAAFNHAAAGATNCQSCHASNRPANHYEGQCSACHSTNAWRPASFDHAAYGATDCQACHTRPANHFTGQCSACHSTSAWRPASFDHAAYGATDCQSCHTRPANHFEGQCSNCHNTSRWGDATFNHPFPMNHGDAKRICTNCHTEGTNVVDCYRCHDQQRMERKHEEKDIFNIAGRCLVCHPTGKED